MLGLKTSAVLSLNGAPQLVLSGPGDAETGAASVAGEATQQVMRMLGSVLRIKISDGRVVVGKFHCFDKHQNVILTDTREYAPLHRTPGASKKGSAKQRQQQHQEEEDKEEEEKELWKTGTTRSLGMALVPGKHIVYIKVESSALQE